MAPQSIAKVTSLPPPPAADERAVVIAGELVALPEGAVRLDLPRADRLWRSLVGERVVVASGEGARSADQHDDGIGRSHDKLWGSRVDPLYVGAVMFAAIASHSAGRRSVIGRRPSQLARGFLAAGRGHAFIGVDGEIAPGVARSVADALLEGLMSAPYEPLSVIVRLVASTAARLVVLGDARLSFARALETAPRSQFAAILARRAALARRRPMALSFSRA